MIIVDKIRKALIEKKITVKRISQDIGISEAGFYKIMRTGSTTVETLIDIADYLELNVAELVENKFTDHNKKCNCEKLASLEEKIYLQSTIIELLNEKLNSYNKLP
jgi:DNA-binding Xre family transcriptional regulator